MFKSVNLTLGLLLSISGLALSGWVLWIVWMDFTYWGATDVVSVLFAARTGQPIDLGLGLRLVHYAIVSGVMLTLGLWHTRYVLPWFKRGKISTVGKSLGMMVKTATRLNKVGKSGIILLSFGALAIVFSLISNSLVPSFIGLTLTLWGFLFLFVLPKRYVNAKVLNSMTLSSLSAINKIIIDSDCRGRAVYLPPYPKDMYVPFSHLKGLKEGLVFISKKNDKVESLLKHAFSRNPKGLYLVPPGFNLANLIEKELGLDLFNANLDSLIETLPNVIVYDLELADGFKINSKDDMVWVEIDKPVYEGVFTEAGKLMSIFSSLGCPLSSSVAYILTKVTGKPVVIEGWGLKNHVIETRYRVLKE